MTKNHPLFILINLGFKHFVLLIFAISVGLPISSQTIITDRPDQTEASSTIPKGSLQLESGILLGAEKLEFGGINSLQVPSNLLRYGLNQNVELRLFHQVEQLSIGDIDFPIGMNDLELGAKIQLFQKEDVNTEIAFLSHVIIPTGSDGLSIDGFGTINKLSIAHDLNDKSSIGYNIGYNNFGTGLGDFTYSVAIGYGLSDKLGLYIEPYGDWVEFKSWVSNFDAGFTYLVKDNFQLDISYGVGLNHNMNYYSLGFSWNIVVDKQE